MKDILYRKIYNALNEDLNMILSDDDFEESEIDLGIHMQNIQTKCSPLYLIQEATNNNDQEKLRRLINNCWDGENPIFFASDDNIKDVVGFSVQALGNQANLNWIDTSNVTDMSGTFFGSKFNGNISKWNVSTVTNMKGMFRYSSFNGDISDWDVSSVTNMEGMFRYSNFNGDISEWGVSSVINMSFMFYGSMFNGDISKWDVSNVQDKRYIFNSCPIKEEYKPKFND